MTRDRIKQTLEMLPAGSTLYVDGRESFKAFYEIQQADSNTPANILKLDQIKPAFTTFVFADK